MIGPSLVVCLLLALPCGASPDARPVGVPQDSSDAGQHCLHVVRRGESIGRIAARYGTTRHALITANHLARREALRAGQRLEVPGCATGRRIPAMVSSSDAVRDSLSARGGAEHGRSARAPEFRPERAEFMWPVDGPVASGFGRRGFWGWHSGVDIKAHQGKLIRAAAPGTVLFSGWQSSYGRVIKVAHPGGFSTVYAHNLKNFVKAGDRVETGAVIGAVGRTGHATGDHLHFEILRRGRPQNPLPLLARREPTPMVAKGG
jgi:murein DD-endopeptidase MepM/ murein hydrolase activator NlpD